MREAHVEFGERAPGGGFPPGAHGPQGAAGFPETPDAVPTGATSADLRRAIETAVMSVFGVSREDLSFQSRGMARVALARQTAMYLAHTVGGLSLTEVGAMFDRDRTTVAHACAVVEDRRDDANFDRALELLERAVVRLMSRGSVLLLGYDA